MPPKHHAKKKSGDEYVRVAGDIRKQVVALEKKDKKRPRMAAVLSEEGEKGVARGFETGKEGKRLTDHDKTERPATFGTMADRDAALAKAEARSPPRSGYASPFGGLSPAGHRSPAGHLSPARHMSPAGSVVPMAYLPGGQLSPLAVGSLSGTPVGTHSVTRSPGKKARDKKTWHLQVAALVCILFALAAASVGAVMMRVYQQPVPRCESSGCHLFSKAFQASMDASVDPCEDFGRYVCGRYTHPRNFSVAEAAAQIYRDEVVAPARNASLIGTGQNALQKSWRFYKSCEDVLDNHTDNTNYVVDGLSDCGISWPTLSAKEVNLVKVMVCLATKMAWPSIVNFQVDTTATDVVRVTMNPSPYTKEVLQRHQSINATEYEAFFNATVGHFRKAWGNTTNTPAVDFATMYNLEKDYEGRFHEEPGPAVIYDESFPRVQKMTKMLKAELLQVMPDRVYPQSTLRLATNHVEFVRWLIQQMMNRQGDVELVLGWHVVLHVAALTNRQIAIRFHELFAGSMDPVREHEKYCFHLTKKYMGVASILDVIQQRFTPSVRSDVEEMAREVRQKYFGTLQQKTYDWKDLSRVLEFFDVALSGSIQQIAYSMGDIHNNIVENMRSVAVSMLNIDESQARSFMTDQLARSHEEPFAQRPNQRDVSMLPLALKFPYYEPSAPLYIKYGAFVSSLANSTAVPYLQMGVNGGVPHTFANFELCAYRDSHRQRRIADVISASAVEAAAIIYAARSRHGQLDEALLLPGLERLTPLQAFYVSYCYLQCAPNPQDVTCNAALRWHEPFKWAFSCKPTSVAGTRHNCHMFSTSAGS